MSLNTLSGFRDFIKPKEVLVDPGERQFTLQEEDELFDLGYLIGRHLTEASKRKPKFKPATGLADAHWDLQIAHKFWEAGRTPELRCIIPFSTCPDIPADTETWKLSGTDNTIFKTFLMDHVKSGIGRGEFSLWWAFQFKKKVLAKSDICTQSFETTPRQGLNWTKPLRVRLLKFWKEYVEENKIKTYLNPRDILKESIQESAEIVDGLMKFASQVGPILDASKKARAQSGMKGFFINNNPKINGACENADKAAGADLIILGKNVEVKAYPSINRKIKIGRVDNSGQYKPLDLINHLFSFHNLFSAFSGKKGAKVRESSKMHGIHLPEVLASFASVVELMDSVPKSITDNSPAFKSIDNLMKEIQKMFDQYASLPLFKDATGDEDLAKQWKSLSLKETDNANQMCAATIMKGIIITTLSNKPGDDNWFFNTDDEMNLQWHKVEFDRLTDDPAKLLTASISEMNLWFNFQNLEIDSTAVNDGGKF